MKHRGAETQRRIRIVRTSIFSLTISIAFIISGCGDVAIHDNEDKYEIFKDETVIGAFDNKVSTYYNYIGRCQSALGGFVADSMMKYVSSADFAIINAGTVRFRPSLGEANDVIGGGTVTKTDVSRFLPFDNPAKSNQSTITAVTLTGAVIKEMFENAFSRRLATGGEGTSFGRFLQVSYSIRVYADVSMPVGSRITSMAITDNKGALIRTIDPNDIFTTYRVAVPTKYIKDTPGQLDYDEYWDIFAKGTNIVDTQTYIYDAVVNTIKNESPINISEVSSCSDPGNRLVITPQ
jgi:hypothetical protein